MRASGEIEVPELEVIPSKVAVVDKCPAHPPGEKREATTMFGARMYCRACAEELSRVLMRAVL